MMISVSSMVVLVDRQIYSILDDPFLSIDMDILQLTSYLSI